MASWRDSSLVRARASCLERWPEMRIIERGMVVGRGGSVVHWQLDEAEHAELRWRGGPRRSEVSEHLGGDGAGIELVRGLGAWDAVLAVAAFGDGESARGLEELGGELEAARRSLEVACSYRMSRASFQRGEAAAAAAEERVQQIAAACCRRGLGVEACELGELSRAVGAGARAVGEIACGISGVGRDPAWWHNAQVVAAMRAVETARECLTC